VLGVALGIGVAVENVDDEQPVTWQITSVDQLERTYDVAIGDTTLDLSALDFSGRQEAVDVHLSVGSLRVLLPARVDAEVTAQVDMGDARVFDQEWGGVGQGQHSVTDTGDDGPGGGRLAIYATVDIGNLEVSR
jgi:predicted membrane protein